MRWGSESQGGKAEDWLCTKAIWGVPVPGMGETHEAETQAFVKKGRGLSQSWHSRWYEIHPQIAGGCPTLRGLWMWVSMQDGGLRALG